MISAIVQFFRRLFGIGTTKRINGPIFGINIHEAEQGDLSRMLTLYVNAKGPLIRTTDYGDAVSHARIAAFAANRCPTLVVMDGPAEPSDVYVSGYVDVQLGNEPDANGVSAVIFGMAMKQMVATVRSKVGATTKIVTGGFSNSATIGYMLAALMSGAVDADAIGIHVYGSDLVMALQNRLTAVRAAMQAANCSKPIWVTEVGFPSDTPDPTTQAVQLARLIAFAKTTVVERMYVYALATDEKLDHFGICEHDMARTPRAAWVIVGDAIRNQ